ncbi:hypothetical protein [Halotia branconii]|uniref:Uncharacterized protein n=1 Tax=Halotia branconii CENA392 TaxID=1539056 RepID=A0AAJ6NPL6_9CYAN|nr:hypothetical protein [Halotia branconii]WGV24233.1 hypothetical protein QI031_20895 [Halotia branconii CENA392]
MYQFSSQTVLAISVVAAYSSGVVAPSHVLRITTRKRNSSTSLTITSNKIKERSHRSTVV